jgi:hypothetical protein
MPTHCKADSTMGQPDRTEMRQILVLEIFVCMCASCRLCSAPDVMQGSISVGRCSRSGYTRAICVKQPLPTMTWRFSKNIRTYGNGCSANMQHLGCFASQVRNCAAMVDPCMSHGCEMQTTQAARMGYLRAVCTHPVSAPVAFTASRARGMFAICIWLQQRSNAYGKLERKCQTGALPPAAEYSHLGDRILKAMGFRHMEKIEYVGGLDDEMAPHGFGVWYDSYSQGELLLGCALLHRLACSHCCSCQVALH